GAARFSARLDDARKGVESAHEADGSAGTAAAGKSFIGRTQRGKIAAGARAPLEEHSLRLRERQDGVERIGNGVDEAGRTLRMAIAGALIDDLLLRLAPVPVGKAGVGFAAFHAAVEPDGRIEARLLLEHQMGQFAAEV